MKRAAAIQRRTPPTPSLILIMGVAGTGKSTLSREILRRIQAVYLDNNHIADAFFPYTRNGHAYTRRRPQLYSALYKIAEENLKIGNSVLLDAPHIKQIQERTWRALVSKLARRANAQLVVVRCLCSENTLRARLVRRGERRDAWKLHHWKSFLTQEPLDVPISLPHLDIDTEVPLAKNATLAARYILKCSAAVQTSFINVHS